MQPYFERVKLGEGGLIGLNFLFVVLTKHSLPEIVLYTMLWLTVLSTLYAYNDFVDRHKDLINPKKNQALARHIISGSTLFIRLNALVSFICILISIIWLSSVQTIILLLLYLVNVIYSNKLKSTPVLDILIVGLWGALFVALVPGITFSLGLTAGLMTVIAHVFQILDDKQTDKQNGVLTTAVALPKQMGLILILLCVILGAYVAIQINYWWCAGALLPVAAYYLSGRVHFSWYLARLYFVAVWLNILIIQYGGIKLPSIS